VLPFKKDIIILFLPYVSNRALVTLFITLMAKSKNKENRTPHQNSLELSSPSLGDMSGFEFQIIVMALWLLDIVFLDKILTKTPG
jgi:hypothetical protein